MQLSNSRGEHVINLLKSNPEVENGRQSFFFRKEGTLFLLLITLHIASYRKTPYFLVNVKEYVLYCPVIDP